MKKRELILTILLTTILLTTLITAEQIGIEIENNFAEKGDINFKITLYDDELNKINNNIGYTIKNPYSDIISEGNIPSGEKFNFQVSETSYPGTWGITATYNGITFEEKFIIDKIKKIDIKLEQDYLIIKNIGNILYDKDILIKINNQDQTARVYLDIGQEKKIKLTAPQGQYTITVNDGTQKQDLVFSQVSLTGNVIGLERIIEGGFWEKYPMVSLFLSVLLLVIIVITTLKIYQKISKK